MTGHAAIVGGGLSGFVAYLTLRRAGIEDVAVFADEDDPAAAFRRRAAAIRQTHMRSESDGHCLPTSFPGLAVRDARTRRSLRPLAESVLDRYHPTVETFLAHVEEQQRVSGWAPVPVRVGRIRAVVGGFELEGCGTFRHVLVATGHPGLHVPEELRGDPRVVHAYEPHEYASKVAVIGAGMAAATEWLNALAAGSEVISVRRREPLRRPLNVPRQYFSKRGLDGFHRTSPRARAALLEDLNRPSYPPGREWEIATERFTVARSVPADAQVIAATGFLKGFASDPLLADLVERHDLATQDRFIVLAPDSTVPALTNGCTLSLAGIAAQWAFPAADTIAGAKYAARAFADRVCRTR